MQTKTNSKTKSPISKSNRLKVSLFRANKTRIKIQRVCTKDLKLSVIFSSLLCAAALAAPSAYAVASSSSGGHASRNSARHTSRITTRSASAVPAAVTTTHPGGLYLGGDVGYNLLDTGQFGKADNGTIIYTHSNIQYGLHLGYNFALTQNLQWLMEGGYRYLGKAKQDDSQAQNPGNRYIYTTRAQAADLLFGLKYYVGSSTSLYGKLGAALQFLKLNNTYYSGATEHRENLDPEWQVGISQNLGEYVSANLGVDHIGSSTTSSEGAYVLNPSVTSLLLGLDFHALASYQLPNFKVAHPGGLYLGGDVGYNLLDTGQLGKSNDGTTIYTHSNIQYGLHLGYNFALTQNLQWLMEGGYRYLGKAKQDDSQDANSRFKFIYTTRAQAADLLFGLKYYVGRSTSLYGKLGAALQFLKLHNTINVPGKGLYPGTEHRQNLNPEWQVGVSQNLGEYVSANFGVDHIGSSTTSFEGVYVLNPSVTSLLLGLDFHALANYQLPNFKVAHPGGLYLGGDVGYNLLDTGQAGKAANGTIIYTHSNIQYGLHIGYNFALTRNLQWLMEGGYRYLGKAKQSFPGDDDYPAYIYTTRAQAADLLFGLKYYVGSSTSLYGKLGAALQFLKLHNTNTAEGGGSGPATEHRQNLDPEWQVGISQNLGEYVSANLGVDHIGSSTTGDGVYVLNPSVTSLLLGLDFHAFANYQLPNFKVAHPGGLYLGGDVGYNLLDTGQDGKADDGTTIYTHSNIQYGLHLGYNFALTPNLQWLMEGGYRYLGKAKQDASKNTDLNSIYTTRAQAADLLFGLKYYVGSSTSLYGKLGAALQFLKLHNTNTAAMGGGSGPATEHRQNLNPEWQVGVSQNLGEYVSANLGVDHIGSSTTGDGNDVLNPSVTSLLVGLSVHF